MFTIYTKINIFLTFFNIPYLVIFICLFYKTLQNLKRRKELSSWMLTSLRDLLSLVKRRNNCHCVKSLARNSTRSLDDVKKTDSLGSIGIELSLSLWYPWALVSLSCYLVVNTGWLVQIQLWTWMFNVRVSLCLS